MKQRIYLILLCAVVAMMTGCTNSSDTTTDVKEQTAWHQLDEAFQAKDLERTLVVIDSMEQAKIVSTAKADHLRGIAYDQRW